MPRLTDLYGHQVVIDEPNLYVFWRDEWRKTTDDEIGRNTVSLLSDMTAATSITRNQEMVTPTEVFGEIEKSDRYAIMRGFKINDKRVQQGILPYVKEMAPEELKPYGIALDQKGRTN